MAEKIGVIRIIVDGEWDMEDLRSLSESMSESYGLLYPLVATDEEVRNRLQDYIRKQYWSGDMDSRNFGHNLYKSIPKEESLRLKSFNYASLGAMELVGSLGAILLAARVAKAWISTGEEFLTLWEKVEKFFSVKPKLRRPHRQTALDDEIVVGVDEARKLVFDVGARLGFDPISCEKLVEIVGNPISALKFIVAIGNEGRKLGIMQENGLLQLPHPGSDGIVLQGRGDKYGRRKGGVQVVVRKVRKKTPKAD